MDKENFIASLKRDRARGSLAPHQIILLIALCDIYNKEKSKQIDLAQLNECFQHNWRDYKEKFVSVNNNLGMPLKAFLKRELLIIEFKEPMDDFRNFKNLEANISKILMTKELLTFLGISDIRKYLETRIDN